VTRLRDQVVELVRDKGLVRLREPVVLASGELSTEFVDAKQAVADGTSLSLACRAMLEAVGDVAFDAVGGLTMGADCFAHGIAVLTGAAWFVVRKQPKGRGTDKLVEGTAVGTGTRVLLVEDVVTTGGSIGRAHEVVTALGATVVAAAALVDRGDSATQMFAKRGVPYFPVATYRDLGIPPVRASLPTAP
jgi:orotate phosphoribosyltransferase